MSWLGAVRIPRCMVKELGVESGAGEGEGRIVVPPTLKKVIFFGSLLSTVLQCRCHQYFIQHRFGEGKF